MINLKPLVNLPISTYLDIGTNTGQFYREITKVCNITHCEFIEPNKFCSDKLLKRFKGIPVHNCAVSDTNGIATLNIVKGKRFSKGASLYELPYSETNTEYITVPVRTLDDMFPTQQFDLLKFDIQGAEMDALLGGRELVQRCSFLILELSTGKNLNYPGCKTVLDYCQSIDFEPIDILEKHTNKKNPQIDLLFAKTGQYKKIDLENIV
jgi:FkbM family methyltransferase